MGHAPWPWTLIDSAFAVAMIEIPVEHARGLLEPGFVPGRTSAAKTTLLGFELNVAKSGATPSGVIQPLAYAAVWMRVLPPPSMRDPRFADSYVSFDALIPDEERRSGMHDLGLPVSGGQVLLDETGLPSRLERDDHTGFDVVTTSAGAQESLSGSFIQFTRGRDAWAVWRTHYATRHMTLHEGVLALPATSPWIRVLGSEQVAAKVIRGVWDYTGGSIEFHFDRSTRP